MYLFFVSFCGRLHFILYLKLVHSCSHNKVNEFRTYKKSIKIHAYENLPEVFISNHKDDKKLNINFLYCPESWKDRL